MRGRLPRGRGLAVLALLAGAAAAGAPGSPAGGDAPPARPGRGAQASADAGAGAAEDACWPALETLGARLRALAERHPEALSVGSIGRSAGGRDLWLATLSDAPGASSAERPALLVVAGFGAGARASTDAAVRALEGLLEAVEGDERAASLLRRATVYVAPCMDPDAHEHAQAGEAGSGAADVAFDRNFPAGWHAWRAGGGAGPYPLSRPATRALAEFLEAHRNVALLQLLGEGLAPVAPATELGESDRAVYRRLDGAAGGDVRAGFAVGRDAAGPLHPGGGLVEFAQRRLGAHGFLTDLAANGSAPGPVDPAGRRDRAAAGRRATDAVRLLARQLPYLLMDEPRVEPLRGSLWRVDVAIRNVGALPTFSGAAHRDAAATPVRLRLEGAEVLAAAVRSAGEDVFLVAGPDPSHLALAPFDGGEERTVRFVVDAGDGRADAAPALRLELSSARSGSTRVDVALR